MNYFNFHVKKKSYFFFMVIASKALLMAIQLI